MCLYEAERKVLMSGDHLLFDITPNIMPWPTNIMPWPNREDSLGMYLASLDKIRDLDVELVLPGHRNVGQHHRARIAQLKNHHQARLDEVLRSLQNGEKTAYEIAPLLSWDIESKPWATLPAIQKWFAFSETLAHLRHLEKRGKVRKCFRMAKAYYSLPQTFILDK